MSRLYITTHSVHYPGEVCPDPQPPAFSEEKDMKPTDWVLVSTAATSIARWDGEHWIFLYWTWEAR